MPLIIRRSVEMNEADWRAEPAYDHYGRDDDGDTYDPSTRDARALTGMTANLWVDTKTYQWIKVRASVIEPVSIVGFHLVRVEPGTTIEIAKAPVEPGIWLTKHLRIKSTSRVFFVVPHHTFYDERDFNYRRRSALVLSTCEGPS